MLIFLVILALLGRQKVSARDISLLEFNNLNFADELG